MLPVPRDHNEVRFQRIGGDHAIGNTERAASELLLCIQCAPSLRHRSGQRQNPARKEDRQIRFKPCFEFRSPLPRRSQDNTLAQLAEAHGADEQIVKSL